MIPNNNTKRKRNYSTVCILFFSLSIYSVIITIAWCWRLSSSSSTSTPNIASTRKNDKEHEIIDLTTIDDFIIDVISIGCKSKEDYMRTQKQTWGLHPSIRNFWPITEMDDNNPYCMYETHIMNHLNMCKRRLHNDSNFMRSVRDRLVWTEEQMLSSKNPHGWLCAQRRVGAGLAKVGKWYRDEILKRNGNVTGVLPDYLLLIDNDTFINAKYFNH